MADLKFHLSSYNVFKKYPILFILGLHDSY